MTQNERSENSRPTNKCHEKDIHIMLNITESEYINQTGIREGFPEEAIIQLNFKEKMKVQEKIGWKFQENTYHL